MTYRFDDGLSVPHCFGRRFVRERRRERQCIAPHRRRSRAVHASPGRVGLAGLVSAQVPDPRGLKRRQRGALARRPVPRPGGAGPRGARGGAERAWQGGACSGGACLARCAGAAQRRSGEPVHPARPPTLHETQLAGHFRHEDGRVAAFGPRELEPAGGLERGGACSVPVAQHGSRAEPGAHGPGATRPRSLPAAGRPKRPAPRTSSAPPARAGPRASPPRARSRRPPRRRGIARGRAR